MKIILWMAFWLFISPQILACSIPRSGSQYDQLIQIKPTSNPSAFTFSVPAELKGLNHLSVELGYSKISPEGRKLMEQSETLNFAINQGQAEGTFTTQAKDSLFPYLRVVWWPTQVGACSVVASSDFIGQIEK